MVQTLGKSLEEVNEVFGDNFVTIKLAESIPAEKLQVSNHVKSVDLEA